jgi:flagellar basal-body rod protein FlgB
LRWPLPMKLLGNVERLAMGLDYHQARHAVLTANLANVDTPGYKARELSRVDSFQSEFAVALRATDARHIGVGAGGLETKVVEDPTTPVDNDGNSVSLDREAVKISANHVRYETISTLVAHELGMLSYAVNDARG